MPTLLQAGGENTRHGAPVDLLKAYALADIPETEQLYADGRMEFLKTASSAAHVYGREVVSAESFVHFGKAYKSTAESLERDANRLIAAGVNQIIYHGFPYVYLDRPLPGWYPFVDPASFSDHFNDHNTKIWPAIPTLNAYISRLQVVARRAHPVARYALYVPDL
jgi:alpha-L-rhamnosidase